jgi:glycerol-3-phosphate dehydrogenase
MAEDCVNQAATLAELPERPCTTEHLNIHGFHAAAAKLGALSVYGTDAAEIQKLMDADSALAEPLHPGLPYVKAEVIWAARHELARTVEDVLARRTRALFLNARAAIEMAHAVASLLAPELGWNEQRQSQELAAFKAVAANYVVR